MVDTLKKWRPVLVGAATPATGRVEHDDRGNAVWEWARDPAEAPPDNTGLAIVDEPPPPLRAVRLNRVAAVAGYNPYESGLIDRSRAKPKKRNMRELSRWIEQRKQRGETTKL